MTSQNKMKNFKEILGRNLSLSNISSTNTEHFFCDETYPSLTFQSQIPSKKKMKKI